MKNRILYLLLASFAAGFVLIEACKKKSEPTPDTNFAMSAISVSEGDTVLFTNKTTNGKTYNWSYSGSKWTSGETNPMLIVDSAGSFMVTLEAANGDGKKSSKSIGLTVMPDTVFRMSANKKKVWIVTSISYNGIEQLNVTCQKDDEFVVVKSTLAANDTCTLNEGVNKCPAGTYLLTLPTTSNWRFKKSKFEFALSLLGSPINLSFAINKCTNQEFEGTDAVNSIVIKMKKK